MNALLHLFLQIKQSGKIPQQLNETLIAVLCKKNSRLECENYRPISLLSHIYKFFISIIALQVKEDRYASFSESQAAYQPDRGTLEQVIAIEQIIKQAEVKNNDDDNT